MLQFVVADYITTGEGITIMMLITMAYPDYEDYDRSGPKPYIDDEGKFHFEMPPLKEGITPEVIALREFREIFGDFFVRGAEVISKEEFKKKWVKYAPAHVVKAIEDDDMGNFKYFSSYHVNYS